MLEIEEAYMRILVDNMDVLRLSELSEKDLARLQRYHISWNVLNNVQE